MATTNYAPASPSSVVTDFDAQSTVYAASAGSPSVGSPTVGSDLKGTAPTSVTGSPSLPTRQFLFGSTSLAPQRPDDPGAKEVEYGWPKLARVMAETPCYESYPRFRELNVKNLIYYQVELAELEARLKKTELADNLHGKEPRREYARHAQKMLVPKPNGPTADGDDSKQREIIRDIRTLLREYNDALLQHIRITALPQPDYLNIESLRVEMKGYGEIIAGAGSSAWGDPRRHQALPEPMAKAIVSLISTFFWKEDGPSDDRDLVATHPPKKLDGLTRWIREDWTPFYHVYLRKRNTAQAKAVTYRETMMLKFTAGVTMVIACILPTVAIGVLTTAKTTMQKLLYIGGFTALFAIGVMWLTDAGTSRLSVFTATAAFSAVLVVFVQGQ